MPLLTAAMKLPKLSSIAFCGTPGQVGAEVLAVGVGVAVVGVLVEEVDVGQQKQPEHETGPDGLHRRSLYDL